MNAREQAARDRDAILARARQQAEPFELEGYQVVPFGPPCSVVGCTAPSTIGPTCTAHGTAGEWELTPLEASLVEIAQEVYAERDRLRAALIATQSAHYTAWADADGLRQRIAKLCDAEYRYSGVVPVDALRAALEESP